MSVVATNAIQCLADWSRRFDPRPVAGGDGRKEMAFENKHGNRGRVKTPRHRAVRYCGKCGQRVAFRTPHTVTHDGKWYHQECFDASVVNSERGALCIDCGERCLGEPGKPTPLRCAKCFAKWLDDSAL